MSPIFDFNETITVPVRVDPMSERLNLEMSRVINAAIVNRRFCENLLSDPIHSIESGFCGESFYFSRETKEQIRSIRARSLEEFAAGLQKIWSLQPVAAMAISY
jgi:hypothetical protein